MWSDKHFLYTVLHLNMPFFLQQQWMWYVWVIVLLIRKKKQIRSWFTGKMNNQLKMNNLTIADKSFGWDKSLKKKLHHLRDNKVLSIMSATTHCAKKCLTFRWTLWWSTNWGKFNGSLWVYRLKQNHIFFSACQTNYYADFDFNNKSSDILSKKKKTNNLWSPSTINREQRIITKNKIKSFIRSCKSKWSLHKAYHFFIYLMYNKLISN
jgi:hypothetical protein